jgi:hypothetical protein
MRVKTLVVASAWTAGFGISGWLAYAQNSSNDVNGAVSQIIPGTNISISPANGKGQVTINASGGSSGSGNATTVNGATVPASCGGAVGTNASSQLTCLSTSTLNISGTAAGLSGTPALPNGTTASTQSSGDNSTKAATDAFVYNLLSSGTPSILLTNGSGLPATGITAGALISGVTAASGGALVGISGTQTLTNKTMDGGSNTFTNIGLSSLGQSSTAAVLGYPGGSSTAPEAFTEVPSGVTLDVSSLTQTSSSDVISINYLPGTATSYPAGSHTVSGADNGTLIYNTASSASTFSLPPINAVAPYVLPSAFQSVMANFANTAVTTLAGIPNVSPAIAAPTLNQAAGPMYLGPLGWSFTLTDGTASPGNYVILEGGGYQFNSAGVAVWTNALIASGFVPNSPACGLTGTGRIASYTGGGLTFCTNGNGAGSLDASGDLAITGYLAAQSFVSGTVLVPTSSAIPATAGLNYPTTYELGFGVDGIQAGYIGPAGILNWNYAGIFTGLQLTNLTTPGIIENNSSGTLGTSTSLPSNTTATTQTTGNSSTYLATTAFVQNTIAAPGALGVSIPNSGSLTTLIVTQSIAASSSASQPSIAISGTNCVSVGSKLGGMIAGSMRVATNGLGSCGATITISGLPAVTNEYKCAGSDETNPAGLVQSGGSTTSCSLTGSVSTNNDKVSWLAIGY